MTAPGTQAEIELAVDDSIAEQVIEAITNVAKHSQASQAVVTVRLDSLGGVTVLTGASSQGQGIETTFAQIVADEFGSLGPTGAFSESTPRTRPEPCACTRARGCSSSVATTSTGRRCEHLRDLARPDGPS